MPSSMSSGSTSSGTSSWSNKKPIDPTLRNALRYTVSAKEYQLLHQYLISRAPPIVKKRTPQPPRYEAILKGEDDYNVATVRNSLRVFVASYAGLRGWELIQDRLFSRRNSVQPKSKTSILKSPNIRISASLSLILFFHRLLHRFFARLRTSLLASSANPFRRRNPRIHACLTSPYTPALGASISGFFLGLCPADQLRVTIAIYVFTRSLEFLHNALDEKGWWRSKFWWMGSWMIMPVACGQLLHAFVFDRDCFPESYGRFILKRSPEYVQQRPETYPKELAWPGVFDIVDSLAEIARLKWPSVSYPLPIAAHADLLHRPFISPILFPLNRTTLPTSLSRVSPVTSSAHPRISRLSCALLHPHDPSCARVYLTYFLRAFPSTTRFFALVFSASSLLSYKKFIAEPMKNFNFLAQRILKMSLFITGAIGTSWGSICFFSNYLPRTTLATQRWFLGGFLGGLWAFVVRRGERSNFLYSARLSLDSFWKVGVKHDWWKGVKGGDVYVFVASLALLNIVYEARPGAVRGGAIRKGMGMLREDGWADRAKSDIDGKDTGEDEGEVVGSTNNEASDETKKV
ncbi:hypothetical protein LTR66_000113 [Elasticomyces elasticus]|nr:hypothetical protein LTR66_000113 [Elasticomyces elasticus]